MKKKLAMLLAFAYILCLFAGCAKQEPVLEVAEEAVSTGTQTVHNVDELISAIAPDTVIQLADGTYNLRSAQSYGTRTDNPYVKWEDCYDGYQLLIHDLDNLTIVGSGNAVTNLVAEPRNANVLAMEDCANITLAGFTAGHTVQAQACSGNVINLERCEGVAMNSLSLYGCGAVGLSANQTNGITLTACEIYDCSSSGIQMYECQEVSVMQCPMHDIGKTIDGWSQGYSVFSFDCCNNVAVSGCTIQKNNTQYMLSVTRTQKIHLYDNEITDNSATNAMMLLYSSDVTVETNNVLENNLFSRWYEKSWDSSEVERAIDETGAEVFTDDPEPIHKTSEPAVSTPVIEGEQKQVRVASVDEFLTAIDSNTEIILTSDLYDLSTATDYGQISSGHYTWEETFDGPQLVIFGVENLSIVSEDGKADNHTISATPRYANVISFRDCKNALVKGITAGHTIEPGSCMGGVLNYEHCTNFLVENCNLYGCGILGVSSHNSDGLQVINSKIYECSYGGISCIQTQNITIGGCEFWDLGGSTFELMGCSGVTIDGQEINGDYWGD